MLVACKDIESVYARYGNRPPDYAYYVGFRDRLTLETIDDMHGLIELFAKVNPAWRSWEVFEESGLV